MITVSQRPLRAGVDTPDSRARAPGARSLVEQLGDALKGSGVPYCQWKGHRKRERWMRGEGDIDLLVDRRAEASFTAVLDGLGFKRAEAPPSRRIPAIESHFGHDPATGSLIHVHVHYRLIVGGYWRTVYRLPLEQALLQSARQGSVFPVPAPELELIVFAVRMVQRYAARDLVRREPRWLAGIQAELEALLADAQAPVLADLLERHLPCLDTALITECLESLRQGQSRWRRLRLRHRLSRRLRPHARRPPIGVTLARLPRWATTRARERRARTGRNRFAHGGTVIALVGGDGAGKSSCTHALADWLGGEFAVMTAHLGRPPRSLLTLIAGAALKAAKLVNAAARDDAETGEFPGYVRCLRDLCTARDRYLLYAKARRFAASGGVALCERHPLPGHDPLAGPRLEPFANRLLASRLGKRLLEAERRYYREILPPDVTVVLLVDPETAVRRKTTEPADYVRARNQWMWQKDWSATDVCVVDAGRPLADVVAELKVLLWSEL